MTAAKPPTLIEAIQHEIDAVGAEARSVCADAEGPYSRDAAEAYLHGLTVARTLAEDYGAGIRREVTVRPAFDCVIEPCMLGGERCAAGDPGANHGRGDAMLHLAIYDELREVRLVIGTGWSHPVTPSNVVNRFGAISRAPHFPELVFHSADAFPGAVGPTDTPPEQCPRGWAACYSAHEFTTGDAALPLLVAEGLDAVWSWLEQQWTRTFGQAATNA